jgi:glutamate-1-semialdehyde 2,1-aminomutase
VPGVDDVLTDSRSAALFERGRAVIPGAVNSPVRAMRAIGRSPLFIASGSGPTITDVDGNTYVDYVCSWGALIAGHAHPAVVAAVCEAAARGTSYGAPTEGEVALAEEVARRVPGAEMVRMTSSGTEAAMTALRIARAHTGRDVVIKFAGAYHGHSDGLLAQAGSGLLTQGIPASPGVPSAVAATTVVVPWNDHGALTAALKAHDVAAIIAEPTPANMGLIAPGPGFLELLREEADRVKALLIFDEVISGFRVGRGGAGARAHVQADLLILGKILGGGLPAAAVAGPRHLLELLAPVGEVYQAGTLSGNPLAVAAGLATLELLDDAAYRSLSASTQRLAEGLQAAAGDRPVSVAWAPGLLTVFFRETLPANLAEAQQSNVTAYGAWCRELLARGVYPSPSQFEAWFPSLAHGDAQIDHTVTAAAQAFAALKDAA